ncbi:MAG: hypothetical protein M0Z28_30290 [Rhodospirillales bacterium]|nr:hypothetical protein [Rhodospirillales bacterium]
MAWQRAAALAAVGIMAGTAAARADVIDGAWCREPARRLTIDGPVIVTPAGNATRGNYSRHYFSYVVPAGEPGAGATVELRLLNEETMQLRTAPDAPIETWHRCSPAVSWQPPGGNAGG